MKNLKTLLLIAVIAVSFNSIQAQSKVAHIDFQTMVELMPETKAMMTELEKLGKTYQDEIKKGQDDLVAKAAKYEKEDRKSVVQGKSVDLGGRRIIKKKKKEKKRRIRSRKKCLEMIETAAGVWEKMREQRVEDKRVRKRGDQIVTTESEEQERK